SLLRRGEHPNDVLERIVGAVLDVGPKEWRQVEEHAAEIKETRSRILSGYNNLLLRSFDPATGQIPDWLPGEFHEQLTAVLKKGGPRFFQFTRGGFYVRRAQGQTNSAAPGTPPPHQEGDEQGSPRSANEDTWPTPYSGREVSQIPRRNFILGQHYLLGAVT